MSGFWHKHTDRSKPNVEIKTMSPYHRVQMCTCCQIWLQCMCWQQTLPNRYIKVIRLWVLSVVSVQKASFYYFTSFHGPVSWSNSNFRRKETGKTNYLWNWNSRILRWYVDLKKAYKSIPVGKIFKFVNHYKIAQSCFHSPHFPLFLRRPIKLNLWTSIFVKSYTEKKQYSLKAITTLSVIEQLSPNSNLQKTKI